MLHGMFTTVSEAEARGQPSMRENTTGAPSGGRTFKSNLKWATVGNALYASCQWAMLVVLAKLGSTESVGAFALALALTAPVFMLAGLQLRGIQATDARGAFGFRAYLALRSLAMAAALVVSILLALVTSPVPELRLTVVLVAAAKTIEGLSDVHYGFLQNHERLDVVGRSLIARGLLALGGVAASMVVTDSPAGAAAGMAVGWALVLAFHDVPQARALMVRDSVAPQPLEWAAIGRLAKLAAPLGFVLMLVSLQTNVPRYFVEHHLGRAQLGIFAALASIVLAGNVFIGALGQAASPRLARQFACRDLVGFRGSIRRLMLVTAGAGVAGLVATALVGRPLLQVLFGPEYAGESIAFFWMAAAGAAGFAASILGYVMTAARQIRQQLPLSVAALAVLTIGCVALVPTFGLNGASWALLLASGLQLLGNAICVRAATKAAHD